MRKRSIRTYMLVPVTVILLVCLAAQAWFMGERSVGLAGDMSRGAMEEASARYAAEFEAANAKVLGALTAYAPMMAQLSGAEGGRAAAIEMLRGYVNANEGVSGVWASWGENAFDGNDAGHAGSAGHDESGRFMPYVFRVQGGMGVEPVAAYEQLAAMQAEGDAQTFASDPYYTTVDGERRLVYCLSVPVSRGGEAVGRIGAEVYLEPMLAGLGANHPIEGGDAFMVSASGMVLSLDRAMMMKPVRQTWAAGGEQQLKELLAGNPAGYMELNNSKKQMAVAARAVQPGGSQSSWVVCVSAPVAAMVAPAAMFDAVIIISAIAVAAAVLIVLCGAAEFSLKELRRMNNMAHAVAAGNYKAFDIELKKPDKKTANEAELLKRDLYTMANAMKRQASAMGRITRGDYTVEIHPRSNTDYINLALRRLVKAGNRILGEISDAVGSVAEHAELVSDGSQEIAARAAEQSLLVQRVGEVAGSAPGRVEAQPDAGALELSASLQAQAEQYASRAADMETAAEQAKQAVAKVADVSGEVAKITEKTKALAMKASLQAAKADAGAKRGFAVLTVEIKDLFDMCNSAVASANSVAEECEQSAEKCAAMAAEAGREAAGASQSMLAAGEAVAAVREVETDGKYMKIIKADLSELLRVMRSNQQTAGMGIAAAEDMLGSADAIRSTLRKLKLRVSRTAITGGMRLQLKQPGKQGKPALMPPESRDYKKVASAR